MASVRGETASPIGDYETVLGDCLAWMQEPWRRETIHAIVTDPPFGVEYDAEHLSKRAAGSGGVWRIPPRLDGCERKPIPRFTVLGPRDVDRLRRFFAEWGRRADHVLVPGGHVIIASNVLFAPYMTLALVEAGLEFRGQVIRIVRTLRGGDRPKLAESEFPNVCVTPRGCYEPWGVFRKPIRERTVAENLRVWGAGGLRRTPEGNPLPDVLRSETASAREVELAPHPSLKPQRFLRQMVWASLPTGRGVVLDPFMGSGSTLAAAAALGYASIGIERHSDYLKMSATAIPALAALSVDWKSFQVT